MNWKQSLDRYLTSGPPDDGFSDYVERTTDLISDEVWSLHEDWILGDEATDLFNKCFIEDLTPEQAAKVFEERLGRD